jgi:hypothetical protein
VSIVTNGLLKQASFSSDRPLKEVLFGIVVIEETSSFLLVGLPQVRHSHALIQESGSVPATNCRQAKHGSL